MARKNLIEISDAPMPEQKIPVVGERPIAGLKRQGHSSAPVGGITKTLGAITEKMERANNLEHQLAEGQIIIDIDPAQVDSSFISDRLELNPQDISDLASQIEEHGQQVPILVRPHPSVTGRYQVAYGHRRLAAVKQLGIKIRAVVRELSDEQLVVSQGQENNARKNLSYIERCLFAWRLEEREFVRETIMAALDVDKQALSKMLIVMRQIPLEVINLIGPAQDIGRRRWMELGARLENSDVRSIVKKLSSADDFCVLSSNDRFLRAFKLVTTQQDKPRFTVAEKQVGQLPVKFKKIGNRSTFVFDDKAAPGFDEYVQQRLMDLYAEFKSTEGK